MRRTVGVRENGAGWHYTGGNICFRATWGRCLCVWPCISKVGLDSFPWTTHCPWHQQEDVMIKHSPIASRKKSSIIPPNYTCIHKHSWRTNRHSETHKLMLLCRALYFLALGLEGALEYSCLACMIAAWGQSSDMQLLPLTHPIQPLLHTYGNYINVFVMHTHMQTQAKNTAHMHPQTQMRAEVSMHQNTHRQRHSNSPPGFICINRGLLELCSRPAFQCLCLHFFFYCGLKQQLSHSCTSCSARVSSFPSLSHS